MVSRPAAASTSPPTTILGLASAPELSDAISAALDRGVAVGAGGSRLLRGNDPEHEALEEEAARFFGAESCLYFGGGFVANYALFSTLPARGDLVVHDALIHASVIDGMRAGKSDHSCRDPQRRAELRRRNSRIGAKRAASDGRGSPSKASTRWMATRPR